MKVSLFALQVFLPLPQADSARRALVEGIRCAPDASGFGHKNQFYAGVAAALLPHKEHFRMGVWDFVEEHERAQTEFETWCKGTIDDAKNAPPADPYRSGGLHMFVTVLLLMARDQAADRTICEACRMPEGTEWQKETFAHLIGTLPNLNFATVRSDAIYVRPARDGGITVEELGEDHYAYLHPLV